MIPVDVRRTLGIGEGTELVALVDGDAVILLPIRAVRTRLRSLFAGVGTSIADELIDERRAAAAEEARG